MEQQTLEYPKYVIFLYIVIQQLLFKTQVINLKGVFLTGI